MTKRFQILFCEHTSFSYWSLTGGHRGVFLLYTKMHFHGNIIRLIKSITLINWVLNTVIMILILVLIFITFTIMITIIVKIIVEQIWNTKKPNEHFIDIPCHTSLWCLSRVTIIFLPLSLVSSGLIEELSRPTKGLATVLSELRSPIMLNQFLFFLLLKTTDFAICNL